MWWGVSKGGKNAAQGMGDARELRNGGGGPNLRSVGVEGRSSKGTRAACGAFIPPGEGAGSSTWAWRAKPENRKAEIRARELVQRHR